MCIRDSSKAFEYFSELALKMMPENEAGPFNEAMMDLGSEICKPKNPLCGSCPLNQDCVAFNLGKIPLFPVKTKKVKPTGLELTYYFVEYKDQFLIKQRKEDFIWKKLYEFPSQIPARFEKFISGQKLITHKLTHKNLTIHIYKVILPSKKRFEDFAAKENFSAISFEDSQQRSFPKPLENYLSSNVKGQ